VGVAARTASAASASLPLIAIAGVAGLLESGSSALFPPLSTKLGFSVGEAAALGAVVGAGSALMQAPFGILADRVGVGRALLAAWTILVVATGALALQSAAPQGMLWPVAFAMGGVGGAVYTLIVIALGNRLTGGALIQAMGWLVVAYALGSVSGPLIGGAIFDLAGFPALALTFVGACIVGLLASLRTIQRLDRI
jgi:MFS family permease